MKKEIKITGYDSARNEFRCRCAEHPGCDTFDPFVSGITNGDEYLDINEKMVGKTIRVHAYPYGLVLLLDVGVGEAEYKELLPI